MANEITVSFGAFDPNALQASHDKAAALLAALKGQVIHNDSELATVNQALRSLLQEKDAAKEVKETVTKPLNQALTGFRNMFKPTETVQGQLETVLKTMIGAYELQKNQQYQALYAKATAAANAGDPAASLAVVQAAEAAPTKLAGTSVRHVWKAQVIAPDLVPRAFLTPDLIAIQAHASACKTEEPPDPIPGVKFNREAIVSVRR